jgi:predicted transcriptional regulator
MAERGAPSPVAESAHGSQILHPKIVLRKDQAAQLLREGHPPSEIARQMGTSTPAVMQYLCLKIGEGDLRRSDIAFSLPEEIRAAVEETITGTGSASVSAITRALQSRGFGANRHDVAIYMRYRKARVVLGDMYELLRAVEVRLHTFVKQAFILEHGEEQWWRSGVPDTIRAECAALHEKDPEPAEDAYCYTHLISLREILDKRWSVLSRYMPAHLVSKKKDLLDRLLKLNRIRNSVMHPVRNAVLTEEDFDFVRRIERDLSDLEAHLREEVAAADEQEGSLTNAEPELVSKLEPVVPRTPAPEQAGTQEDFDALSKSSEPNGQ